MPAADKAHIGCEQVLDARHDLVRLAHFKASFDGSHRKGTGSRIDHTSKSGQIHNHV